MNPPGIISATEAYTVQEFRKRAGLGDYTWRQVRQQLPVIKIGRKRYVLGAAWIQYLQQLQYQEHHNAIV